MAEFTFKVIKLAPFFPTIGNQCCEPLIMTSSLSGNELFQPWQFKHGTVERGNVWKAIAESLISLEQPKFKQIDDRAVRDHYRTLEKKQKKTSSEKGRVV